MLILISDAFDPSLPERLSVFGEVTEDRNRLAEADAVLVRSKTKCTREYIDGAPNLKLIIRGGVGTDNIDTAYALGKGIVVKNTPKASAISVAEVAFALMISVPNQLVTAHVAMTEGRWLKNEIRRTELFGKTLCLVGMGNIAREMALRGRAFGMKTIACRQSGLPSDFAEVRGSLKEAFSEADYISLHVPLTDETRNMINRESISWMKDGVAIINTARGKCVVEEDLAAALESGKVGAYASDVWFSDPPSPDCPLLKAPNVTMTPHIGANSEENLLRISDEVCELIHHFVKGDLKG